MAAEDDRHSEVKTARDFRNLPPRVRLEETIASVEPGPAPDPEAGRNVDQHRALRDD
jgi:hypothetical protein